MAHIRRVPTPTPVGVGVGTSLIWAVHQTLLTVRVWLCKTTVVSQACESLARKTKTMHQYMTEEVS